LHPIDVGGAMLKKRSRIAYWGESLREAGILLMVFGPMYLKFDSKATGLQLLIEGSAWMICGNIVLEVGVELERRF
jgi:hypothetical protein